MNSAALSRHTPVDMYLVRRNLCTGLDYLLTDAVSGQRRRVK